MNSQERKAYGKAYRQAHKEEAKAYMKAYYESHKEQIKEQNKAYNQAHKEERKAYMKEYYETHKENYRDYQRDYMKAYSKSDVNSKGQTKHSIRMKSLRILKQMNLHIDGYEIHHCFGYDDPSKFIYCSKSLHRKIHQYLRDNNISAGTDHWMTIRDIVNSADEFTYIKC